jgi:hypothetical protein
LLRVVAFRKAILAGAAGALAWEAAIRILALFGVPVFDLVRQLGTLPFHDAPAIQWWPIGMLAHATVGAAWALFYAYFFWARFRWPPMLQGLAFAALPAVLAILIVVPQLRLMHLDREVAQLEWRSFLVALESPIIGGLLVGHALFGLTVGAIYTHPVGYPAADQCPDPPRSKRPRNTSGRRPRPDGSFIFATGIECSYPTTEQGRWRRDEMRATGHYRRWREDFELAREVGVTHIRYGPPLHLTFTGPGQFDWDWSDDTAQGPRKVRSRADHRSLSLRRARLAWEFPER